MLTLYRRSIKEKKLCTVSRYQAGVWMYLVDPNEQELTELENRFKFNKSLLTDALDPFEAPRMEVEDGKTYVFTRFPVNENGRVITVPLVFVLSKDIISTVSRFPLPFLVDSIQKNTEAFTTQKTRLFIQLYSQVNSQYSVFLHEINREVRRLSSQPVKIKNKDIIHFIGFEETLNLFLAELKPMSTTLKKLLSGRYLRLYATDEELVEDIILSTEQLIDIAESNLKTISNIREAYNIIVTNQLNNVMKLFTVLTVVLTFPTIVASLYGMNVPLPGSESPYAFGFILSLIFAFTLLLIWIFKRNEWL